MVSLDITETSKALAVAGGYVITFGLVSYFVKEKLFMSEALLALVCGIALGPIGANLFAPELWSTDPNYLTYQITRIVIAIQVLFTGISLPKAYLRKEWLSLTTLLGPIMISAWFVTSLLIWGLIPGLTFLECLVIGACVTPTDPVLANSICKGRFAEKHVPLHVRNIILAESGANDGLGFPFLYMGLYLILINEPTHPYHTIGGAVAEWIYNVVLYQIVLSCILGAIIGYIARKVLRFAEERSLIDHESLLSFGVALTFFTLGVVGILGSDDIFCCFIVGNSFTWDDWFRVQTEDHAFQDVIDQLINTAMFIYIGAILPWSGFGNFESITPWRLVILGILVMLLRRLPWVMALSRYIPSLVTWQESAFAGFFGPIGVGAIFYVQVALEKLPDDGTRDHLRAVITPVVYFLVLTSVIVHGITIPIGKGFHHARSLTISRSQTANLTGEGGVSRLPPVKALPITRTMESGSGGSDVGEENGPSIRFDLEQGLRAGRPVSNGSVGRVGGRGKEVVASGRLSRPGTPPLSPAESRARSRNGDGRVNGGRESEEMRQKGEAWLEGNGTVIESEDGERVRVVYGDGR